MSGGWRVSPGRDMWRILDGRDHVVAHVLHSPDWNTETVANKIAAAPDLLACCDELRNALAGAMRIIHKHGLDLPFADEMQRIGIQNGVGVRSGAAITKAEGRS